MTEATLSKCKQIVLNLYSGVDMEAEGDAFKDICVQTTAVKQAFDYIDYCPERSPRLAVRFLRDKCEAAAEKPNNTDETRRTFIVMAETFNSIMRIFQTGGAIIE